MAPEDQIDSSATVPDQPRGVSRREVLTGAAVVAAGVGLAATGPAAPAAAATTDVDEGLVGVAGPGVNAGEFRSRIAQNGITGGAFASSGYLTKAAGASDADLFADAVQNETTALFTVVAEGSLEKRVLDQSVHVLDIVGSLTIYQRSAPGASSGDPASFQVGTPVARFALTLQDILTVFAPGRGIPTLTGDMRQTSAKRVAGPGKHFGRVNMRARVFATGIGQLINPVTFSAQFEMAGNWTVEQ